MFSDSHAKKGPFIEEKITFCTFKKEPLGQIQNHPDEPLIRTKFDIVLMVLYPLESE